MGNCLSSDDGGKRAGAYLASKPSPDNAPNALARDIQTFIESKVVPEGIKVNVPAETKQVWFERVSQAWRSVQTPPRNGSECAALLKNALRGIGPQNLEAVLYYYGVESIPELDPQIALTLGGAQPSKPMIYEITTLPVEARNISVGDCLAVYSDVRMLPPQLADVPVEVTSLVDLRKKFLEEGRSADVLRVEDQLAELNYRVVDGTNGEPDALTKRLVIRLRGVDCPMKTQKYGPEATSALKAAVSGRECRAAVYDVDRKGQYLADLFCGKLFVQEMLLRTGLAWHFVKYDDTPALAQWQAEAKESKRGLWQDAAPLAPWLYRWQQKQTQKKA
eukprot:jgi/Mesvir1/17593/Mv08825-RA.1